MLTSGAGIDHLNPASCLVTRLPRFRLQRQPNSSWLTRFIRLQILLFPLQTGSTGLGEEPDSAPPVLHFPMLRGVVEFDLAGSVDF